eukprot:g20701.t1
MPNENDDQHGADPRLDRLDDSDDRQKVIDWAAEEAARSLKFRNRSAAFGGEDRASEVPQSALEEIHGLDLLEREGWIGLHVASLSGEREKEDFRDPIGRLEASEELKSLIVIFTDPKHYIHARQHYTQDFKEEAPLVICWRNCPVCEDSYNRKPEGTYFQFAGFFPKISKLPSCVLTNNLFTGTHARQLYDKNSITLHESYRQICRDFDLIVRELDRRDREGTLQQTLGGRVILAHLFPGVSDGSDEDSEDDDRDYEYDSGDEDYGVEDDDRNNSGAEPEGEREPKANAE